MNRPTLLFKLITQLGIRSLLLYAQYRLSIVSGYYRRLDSRIHADADRAGQLRPIFALPDRDMLRRSLSARAVASIRREADAALKGKVRLFSDRVVPLRLAPGKDLRHWVDYERDPALLAGLSMPLGDIKFLWEPARFAWAYRLACAFYLSRREEYARGFWKYFEQFDRTNPAYRGPHWMNGQEVAIRLMALLWAAHVIGSARASTPRRLARLTRSLALHAARISPTLVYARAQNNNHLVTEATALFLAGRALDHPAWSELGWKWLNRALQSQVSSYGEYIQHSTNYHRLVLDCVLLVQAAGAGSGAAWPSKTQQAISRAAHWLFSMIDPVSGRAPNLGANDGSLILPLSACSFDDYRPTVQAASRAFLRTSLPAGDWDDLSLWLGLPRLDHSAGSDAYAAEHLRARDSWAYLRASSAKSRLSHMDQLHMDLWWRGQNVVADAGTYLYNAAPPWDNPLVSSHVHNCITIDGREQMTRAGRFMTLDWFPAFSAHVLASQPPVLRQIRGTHRGYEKLGLRHERTLSVLENGVWRAQDEVAFAGRRRHMIGLHWLLMDGEWRLQQEDTVLRLRIRIPGGWMDVTIAAQGAFSSPVRATLVRAGRMQHGDGSARPWDGWISSTYGRKEPALSLSLEAEAFANCAFITEFRLPGSAGARPAKP